MARSRRLAICLLALASCQRQVVIPAGQLPAGASPSDLRAAAALATPPPEAQAETKSKPVAAPASPLGKTADGEFPDLKPAPERVPAAGEPLTLAQLQRLAADNSPILRRAAAEVEAAYGAVVQAGLYPNPTFGYQVDAAQPGLRVPPPTPGNGAGQQGAFVSQLIKTAGKLPLAQRVAGYDYVNALVAVRSAEVDVATAVRTHYFRVLVVTMAVEVNTALTRAADESYRAQVKRVRAGEAASYEPLQLYAQAQQARNALTQAEADYQSAWRQLAAALGQPDRDPSPLAGRADAVAPSLDQDALRSRIEAQHTDLLTARNSASQAATDLTYQRRLAIPDISAYNYHQYDNLAQQYQFGVQLGVQLPVSDRNQGNIRRASARIARSAADLAATRNDLFSRLAEAFGRYQSNRTQAARIRDEILPNLLRAYRGIVRRAEAEPDKVPFVEVVAVQSEIGTVQQSYLAALAAQWQAVTDLAGLAQLDELYAEPAGAAGETPRR